jgi:hypothetical protein
MLEGGMAPPSLPVLIFSFADRLCGFLPFGAGMRVKLLTGCPKSLCPILCPRSFEIGKSGIIGLI